MTGMPFRMSRRLRWATSILAILAGWVGTVAAQETQPPQVG